jgi:hypothetical protein
MTMRITDQRKMIQELRYYASTMDRKDRYEFDMFEKRDKEDEELDNLSFAKLEVLHKRYVVKKTKADVEELWKKMTGKERGPNKV